MEAPLSQDFQMGPGLARTTSIGAVLSHVKAPVHPKSPTYFGRAA